MASKPTLDEWRRLFDLAVKIKKMAPWRWIPEEVIFGVQPPGYDEPGFVSVTGSLGEMEAATVYLGREGLQGYLRIIEGMYASARENLMWLRALQVSFEDRTALLQEDRDVIKQLGLRFRGKSAYPVFRNYTPGYLPWILSGEDARFLIPVLEVAIEIFEQSRTDPNVLHRTGAGGVVVRKATAEDGAVRWQDEVMDLPDVEPPTFSDDAMPAVQEKAQLLPEPATGVIQVDVFVLPGAVMREERPEMAYGLIGVDGETGMILLCEMMFCEGSPRRLWQRVPETLIEQLAQARRHPEKIQTPNLTLLPILQDAFKGIGIEVELGFCREVRQARDGLAQFMSQEKAARRRMRRSGRGGGTKK